MSEQGVTVLWKDEQDAVRHLEVPVSARQVSFLTGELGLGVGGPCELPPLPLHLCRLLV